jgi:catabolite regulation protein CreA
LFLEVEMKMFHFSGHDIPRADIINARVSCSYADLTLFVDIELEGGTTMSLSQDDSLVFMEDFIKRIRDERGTD